MKKLAVLVVGEGPFALGVVGKERNGNRLLVVRKRSQGVKGSLMTAVVVIVVEVEVVVVEVVIAVVEVVEVVEVIVIVVVIVVAVGIGEVGLIV